MATIESVLALRDQITPTLTGATAAAKQMTETMEQMQDIAVDELVTPNGIHSLDNASQAAKTATDNMARLQEAATNDLVGLDEVNRMDLMAKQASLMESKWINQQMLVSKLSSEYNRVVNVFGRVSDEAEKLDAALFQAQLQENRLALQALKAAKSIQDQDTSAQNAAASINKQFMEVQKMWLNQQKIETAAKQTALAEQKVLKEAERITTEKHKQEQLQRKIETEVQQTALKEQMVLKEAEKINTEKLRQERLQQQISQGQASLTQAAQQSHFQLFNVYAALQLIKTAVNGITKSLTWADEYSGIAARLNLINDGLMTQSQLQSEIYKSAQDTRSAYTDTSNLVTRIGMNASGLFDSNKSLVNFAGLTTKAMKVSGGSSAEIAQAITQRALAQVAADVDKRQGSIIWDALGPACAELAQMYIELDRILKLTYAETAAAGGFSEWLRMRCAELGVHWEQPTAGVRLGLFYTGSAGNRRPFDVPIGSRYSIETLDYIVTEKIETGKFKLQCEETGVAGNQLFGRLIPIETNSSLTYAELADILIPGENEESDESLYARYEKAVNEQPYGGNIADYKRKVNSIDGIQDCKVFPVWNGGGTVKVCLITTEYGPPSDTLVADVQEKLDPEPYHQMGKGLAPIGHWVTIVGVKGFLINLETTLLLRTGITVGIVQTDIESVLKEYFLDLAKTWVEEENIIVRISQIEAKILNVKGIIDISGTRLNGGTANILLGPEEIPVCGEVMLDG